MKKFSAIVLVLALWSAAGAQSFPGGASMTHSVSGQFVVVGAESATLPARFPGIATNLNFIALEPTLLAVSCERIKDCLNRQLRITGGGWRGKIYLNLREARGPEDQVTVILEKSRRGWIYRVELPDVLERNRFVGAIVRVLLLEQANRGGPQRSAEIPAWLAEGLSQQIMASSDIEIVLPPPRWRLNGLIIGPTMTEARKSNPLIRAHQTLQKRAPMTFDELSWPGEDQLSGEPWEVYRSSAQLFVDHLLHLENGPACLRTMIDGLSRHLNWQITFLEAFRAHFKRPLDVEKWWALQLVQFTGRDLTQLWTFDESWQRLNDLVRPSVQVRTGAESSQRAQVTMQIVIREWEQLPQMEMMRRKLSELDLMRAQVAHGLIPLVDDYRQVLREYLQKRNTPGTPMPLRKTAGPLVDQVAEQTIQQLNVLDARIEALRPLASGPVAAAAEAGR